MVYMAVNDEHSETDAQTFVRELLFFGAAARFRLTSSKSFPRAARVMMMASFEVFQGIGQGPDCGRMLKSTLVKSNVRICTHYTRTFNKTNLLIDINTASRVT